VSKKADSNKEDLSFKCPYCERVFLKKCGLLPHRRSHEKKIQEEKEKQQDLDRTLDKDIEIKDDENRDLNLPILTCITCNQTFSNHQCYS
jgi:hypothetical protein